MQRLPAVQIEPIRVVGTLLGDNGTKLQLFDLAVIDDQWRKLSVYLALDWLIAIVTVEVSAQKLSAFAQDLHSFSAIKQNSFDFSVEYGDFDLTFQSKKTGAVVIAGTLGQSLYRVDQIQFELQTTLPEVSNFYASLDLDVLFDNFAE